MKKTEVNVNDVVARLVKVRMTIHEASPYRKDKQMTLDAEARIGAEADTLSVTKKWLPVKWEKPLVSTVSELRKFWNQLTVPWEHGTGWDVVNVDNYQVLLDGVATRREALKAIIIEMTNDENYPELKVLAAKRLGKGFKIEEFPTQEELRRKYDVSVNEGVIPRTDDIRVEGLTDAATKNLQERVMGEYAARLTEVSQDIIGTLKDLLTEMVTRLSKEKQHGVRYGSLMNTAKRLVGQLHNLNLTKNPELSMLIDTTIEVLTKADSEALRLNPEARDLIVKQAATLTDALVNFG